MATIVLSAAGAAFGGSIGGSVLGLSMATVGRAAGAALGRVIDQQVLGAGSEPVEVGRVDRFRLTGASEGMAVQQVFGRMRVPGQVIWATNFLESQTTSGGGKGAATQPNTTEFGYTVSLAIALCEGEITRVGRVWADGTEIAPQVLNMRTYKGTSVQQPDPKIVAVEGADHAPAYRGIAYVVLEDLELGQFGNRVPQLTFEVMRPSEPDEPRDRADIARQVRGVAMIPGTGEFSLSTGPVYLSGAYGEQIAINENTPSGQSDFLTATAALTEEMPACKSVSLVVSWFGTDLRCGACEVAPKVEQKTAEGDPIAWRVADIERAEAGIVPQLDGRPVYGGTPGDQSVVEAIKELRAQGQRPMFYPFILMEQMSGNGLPDPWSSSASQAVLPWRGRITTSKAPGQPGSPDETATATAQVDAFFGTASPSDFTIDGEAVHYTGPSEWRYRRFILHYAHLCAAAGGVSAFCIGSEMVALTQIRGAGGSFPAVDALCQLAAECRAILGPSCKISYAADWSEYHGYQPVGTSDKHFHLDPLWADPNIDFIGIDNYMPLSDWRDGSDHVDASWNSIYNLDYLQSNITGGEGYDWYYATQADRDAQNRTPITDGDGEPWVWRYKDLPGWWSNPHHNRINGQRQATSTSWVPESKPIWFTEFGCAAIDKGTNQPNKFLDPKSSESFMPFYSNGLRDDFMQMQYLRAFYGHYAVSANNPLGTGAYNGRMIDMSRAHVWAWDARPFPFFPANASLWSDGDNYARGHWLNGRTSSRTLASVVAEICERAGVTQYDVSKLYGLVRGYVVTDAGSARAALQPLMLAYGFEVVERDGTLVFFNRDGASVAMLTHDDLALDEEKDTVTVHTRHPAAEVAGRVQVGYLDAEGDYEAAVSETIHPDDQTTTISRSEFPLALTRTEGAKIAARWTHEARVAKDSVTFALPPSQTSIGAGDIIDLRDNGRQGLFRIDRTENAGLVMAEATRIDQEIYLPQSMVEETARLRPFKAPTPVEAVFMDLPLLTGDETPHEPHLAITASPWKGSVAVYASSQDNNYALQDVVSDRSTIGVTQTALAKGPTGIWDRRTVRVKLVSGGLSSATQEAVLSGANSIAIGDGSTDQWEVFQFLHATLVDQRTYDLSGLLRGQSGSDGVVPDAWPAGSKVVLLDGRPSQVSIPSAARGTPRHYRYGPVIRAYSDRSYRHQELTFKGNGYRPYSVAHLRAELMSGDLHVDWIRRTRIDGDIWSDGEVPLGEETEAYILRVQQGQSILREEALVQPSWTYSAAAQTADTGGADFEIAVAQVSARYGTGPFQTIKVSQS